VVERLFFSLSPSFICIEIQLYSVITDVVALKEKVEDKMGFIYKATYYIILSKIGRK